MEAKIFEGGFRADLILEEKTILALKAIEQISHAHKKQPLTELILSGLRLGFPVTFGDEPMKNCITRIINGRLKD